jgi:hypothetical protein
MIKRDSITFTVWEGDQPLEIQLEPEAITLIVSPNEDVTFLVINPEKEFSWTVRYDKTGIQLFPETLGSYDKIEVYRNGVISDEFDFLWE